MSLNKIALIAAATSAVVMLMTGTSFAKSFEALYSVNIHANDTKKSKIIDTLYEGERVNVTQCDDNQMCFVTHAGPDGWVPMASLERIGNGGDSQVVISFGGGGIYHHPKPPVIVDPVHPPKFPVTNVGNLPVSVFDPGTGGGSGNGGGSGGSNGGSGGGSNAGQTIHPTHPIKSF